MDPLRIEAGERSADEILTALEEGRRVVVATEMFGSDYELTLRHDGDTYYCDTPTRLHKHDEQAKMRQCIQNMGYDTDD
ncbi:MAG: hypothetical protein ABEJ79_10935 [Halolamina sp.]